MLYDTVTQKWKNEFYDLGEPLNPISICTHMRRIVKAIDVLERCRKRLEEMGPYTDIPQTQEELSTDHLIKRLFDNNEWPTSRSTNICSAKDAIEKCRSDLRELFSLIQDYKFKDFVRDIRKSLKDASSS